jgi:hypothetical protein
MICAGKPFPTCFLASIHPSLFCSATTLPHSGLICSALPAAHLARSTLFSLPLSRHADSLSCKYPYILLLLPLPRMA